jgi:lysyl-tRNA synthetase, class I
MEEKIAASAAQMRTFTFETTITKDDMEKFLASVVVDDIGSTFVRIASEFVESRPKLEAQVDRLIENSPLMAMITQTVMAEKHVAAKVGSVEDDPFGRLIRQATESMSFNDVWLIAALDRAIEVHGLTPHHVVGWAARTRLFDDLNLLMEGVTAWFAGDFVKAIHVLIPQIEAALRAIAEKLGKPTTKAHPKITGVSVAVNMGDLLYSQEVTDALGADITLYLLTVYADPRGFNLRNDMAHGLLGAGQMSGNMASRLIHTLLVLGIWDQLAQARKAQVIPTT